MPAITASKFAARDWISPFAEDPLLRSTVERLKVAALQPIPDVEIEDKVLSASVPLPPRATGGMAAHRLRLSTQPCPRN